MNICINGGGGGESDQSRNACRDGELFVCTRTCATAAAASSAAAARRTTHSPPTGRADAYLPGAPRDARAPEDAPTILEGNRCHLRNPGSSTRLYTHKNKNTKHQQVAEKRGDVIIHPLHAVTRPENDQYGGEILINCPVKMG